MTSETRYEVLSPSRPVSMGDEWFDTASLDHFWIQRRFAVLRAICGSLLRPELRVAEIGCGIGLVQRQFEDRLGIPVDGFDLNASVLQRSVSRRGRLACYDVEDRREELRASYDMVLLLDVIEHVRDADGFLDAAAFLMARGGHLVVNVPASPRLFSRYDEAAGHLRRYTPAALLASGQSCGLEALAWTYWGLPLVPLALARKLVVARADRGDVIRRGFDPRSPLLNRALALLARAEPLPQKLFGTSLLAVFRPVSE